MNTHEDIERFEHDVAVIGAGRVGQALALLLRRAGARITAVSVRRAEDLDAAALATGGRGTTDNAEAARSAKVVLVTVGDDDIESVVCEIAGRDGFSPGQFVIHASGVHGLAPLRAASSAGAMTGCVHPLQSFVSVPHAVDAIPGTIFGVTTEPDARELLEALVRAAGGVPVLIEEADKPLYHAAASVASNLLVALEDMAIEMFVRAGMPEASAREAVDPLLQGTVANVRRFGTRQALTGPIVRGDIETVRRHLQALEALPALYRESYRALAAHAVDMAESRGDIDGSRAGSMHRLLGGERTL